MKKIVLLNAPPRAGKNYAASYITEHTDYKEYSFAAILKERTHRLYGLDKPANYYETQKDDNLIDFMGLTPREAYINVSEKYFKPVHGKSIFGDILGEQIKEVEKVIVTDCGFYEEVHSLISRYGPESIVIIRLHRESYDFLRDSRGYVYIKEVESHDINNDGVSNKYIDEILAIINNV